MNKIIEEKWFGLSGDSFFFIVLPNFSPLLWPISNNHLSILSSSLCCFFFIALPWIVVSSSDPTISNHPRTSVHMHPFCCVSDHSPSMASLPEQPPLGVTRSEPMMTRSASQSSNRQSSRQVLQSLSFNHQSDVANLLALPALAIREPPVDVKINDIVGNGIAGILHKWVNYGRGWRPRWFVLQDGVLSYYKIHGPDKIFVSPETEKGSKVIGEESTRMIARHHNKHGGNSSTSQLRRKPFGEVHLKVIKLFLWYWAEFNVI